jgi:hypothetical protein
MARKKQRGEVKRENLVTVCAILLQLGPGPWLGRICQASAVNGVTDHRTVKRCLNALVDRRLAFAQRDGQKLLYYLRDVEGVKRIILDYWTQRHRDARKTPRLRLANGGLLSLHHRSDVRLVSRFDSSISKATFTNLARVVRAERKDGLLYLPHYRHFVTEIGPETLEKMKNYFAKLSQNQARRS